MGLVIHSVGSNKIITANTISLHPNSPAREALAHFKDAAQRQWPELTPAVCHCKAGALSVSSTASLCHCAELQARNKPGCHGAASTPARPPAPKGPLALLPLPTGPLGNSHMDAMGNKGI